VPLAAVELPSREVIVERDGSVLVITLNRPEQRNAVNAAVSEGVAGALTELDESPELSVAVLTGAAGCFSAGMDLKAFARGERTSIDGRGFAGLVEAPPTKPIIAAIEGWALGGGFEMALACDLAIASTSARFGLPEVRRGLVARGGGAFRLPRRLPYAVAMEMLLTGETMTAERAEHFGLINRVVPEGQARQAAVKLGRAVARNAPLAVAASKAVVAQSAEWPVGSGFQRQREYFDVVFASDDAREGAAAFRDRREPVWQGR
jgi:enoyl-CoA hydratase